MLKQAYLKLRFYRIFHPIYAPDINFATKISFNFLNKKISNIKKNCYLKF